ncbi:hypothetical protein CDAR_51221 [Caerostris darwini]|uniref:Uncharacterized protein n=1 Tax=Caerostris darwini TaxID=1538125 RepID=A0AAV4U5Y2_9ARAC|nr:hypothetical protein CDAR_51221 [Caerostris darwini]
MLEKKEENRNGQKSDKVGNIIGCFPENETRHRNEFIMVTSSMADGEDAFLFVIPGQIYFSFPRISMAKECFCVWIGHFAAVIKVSKTNEEVLRDLVISKMVASIKWTMIIIISR